MAFYAYREEIFDILIERVEKNGKDLVIHEMLYDKTINTYFPFPHHLLSDERDKQAVLTVLTCADAVGYMHEMLKVMLNGIYSEIFEESIRTKPHPRNVTVIRGDGSSDTVIIRHEVISLSLKNEERYVLDIAGAQHGCYDSVYPLDQYVQSRVLAVRKIEAFGQTQKFLLSDETCSRLTVVGVLRITHKDFVRWFNVMVNEWQKENLTLGEMLKLPEERFHKMRGKLISTISEDLQFFKEWREKNGQTELVTVTRGVLKP
ncbi:MAG: hypothetical protein ASARMPREDX12_005580 [Alectoria sarmentosa]|nr:MAG: hypothetical protein ASARMPREDX12_005580 [Alectoria sarmentosa]